MNLTTWLWRRNTAIDGEWKIVRSLILVIDLSKRNHFYYIYFENIFDAQGSRLTQLI